MNLHKNDTVVVNGKTAKVLTSWGSGAHRTFKLDDGREILDLDKLIVEGKATVAQKGQTQTATPIPVVKKDLGFQNPFKKE